MVVYLGILFDDADFNAESDSYNKDAEYDIDILIQIFQVCYCLLGLSFIFVLTGYTFDKIVIGMCKKDFASDLELYLNFKDAGR